MTEGSRLFSIIKKHSELQIWDALNSIEANFFDENLTKEEAMQLFSNLVAKIQERVLEVDGK